MYKATIMMLKKIKENIFILWLSLLYDFINHNHNIIQDQFKMRDYWKHNNELNHSSMTFSIIYVINYNF